MLYITRHGKTDWNNRRKIQGRTDIPLNDEGREMAENGRDECKDIHIDVCYCSPLARARETAEILLKGRDIPVIADDRLIEMSFGEFEGLERSFDIPDCPVNVLFKTPEKYTSSVGGAETFEELFARTGEFLKEVAEPLLQQGKDVLIVGHAASNASIICQVRGLPVSHLWDTRAEQCRLMKLK